MEQLGQCVDVNLRHLQSLVFGKLLVVVERRDDAAQLVERVVEPVHAPPFARVGRHSPLLLDTVDWFAGRGPLPLGRVRLGPADRAFEAAQVPDFERRRGGVLCGFSEAGRAGMSGGIRGATL